MSLYSWAATDVYVRQYTYAFLARRRLAFHARVAIVDVLPRDGSHLMSRSLSKGAQDCQKGVLPRKLGNLRITAVPSAEDSP